LRLPRTFRWFRLFLSLVVWAILNPVYGFDVQLPQLSLGNTDKTSWRQVVQ
jgi:hypothetical protein